MFWAFFYFAESSEYEGKLRAGVLSMEDLLESQFFKGWQSFR